MISNTVLTLYSSEIDTPLGPMMAIASDTLLYLLEFTDRPGLTREIERLKKKKSSIIIAGLVPPLVSIVEELKLYFEKQLSQFKTPFAVLGTPFQQAVWAALKKIPSGQTRSYLELAHTIQRPTACRAVAQANSHNQLAILIPCHRVRNHSGALGGYAGGVHRKAWLIDHEQQ